MTLAIVAAAQMLADDVDAWGLPQLRALMPVAGMTVIEQQALRAKALGAERFLVGVDSIPGPLAEAFERIRGRGLVVEPVREPAAVIAGAAGCTRVILVADGLVADDAAWAAVGATRDPCVLAANDIAITQSFERIDAAQRWGGLAAIDAAQLATLADAPAGWDGQLVLLRQAIQSGARRVTWDDAQFVSGAVAIASDAAMLAGIERRLMGAREERERGLGRRWLIGPVIRLAGGWLLGSQRSGAIARSAALALALGAAVLLVTGHVIGGAALGWLAAASSATAGFVARFRPEPRPWRMAGASATGAQLLALAVAERGVHVWPPPWSPGSGGLGMSLLVMLSLVVMRRRTGTPLVDFAAAWPMWLGLRLSLGADVANIAVAAVAAALLLWSMRAEDAPAAAA